MKVKWMNQITGGWHWQKTDGRQLTEHFGVAWYKWGGYQMRVLTHLPTGDQVGTCYTWTVKQATKAAKVLEELPIDWSNSSHRYHKRHTTPQWKDIIYDILEWAQK